MWLVYTYKNIKWVKIREWFNYLIPLFYYSVRFEAVRYQLSVYFFEI